MILWKFTINLQNICVRIKTVKKTQKIVQNGFFLNNLFIQIYAI